MNIVATTNTDSDGEALKFSDLLEMRNKLNGNRRMRFGIEHNQIFPPLGQLYNFRIEQDKKGKYQLIADNFFYDEELIVVDGEEYIKCSHKRSKPFIEVNKTVKEKNQLYFDYLHFKTIDARKKFATKLEKIDQQLIIGRKKRKSAFLDPEVTLILGSTYIASKVLIPIGEKLVGKIIEDIGDDLFDQYKKVKNLLAKCVKIFKKRDKKVRVILQIPTEIIEIELIHTVQLNRMDDFLDSISPIKLAELHSRSLQYKEQFDAEKIQFVLNDKFEWKFNYLLTIEGETIGTKKRFEERTKVYKKMIAKGATGLSYGGNEREIELKLGNTERRKD